MQLPTKQEDFPVRRSVRSRTHGISGCPGSKGAYYRYGWYRNADDALEFILAGATAVAIGTANFHDPYATVKTVDGIKAYMEKYGIEDINELIGAVK